LQFRSNIVITAVISAGVALALAYRKQTASRQQDEQQAEVRPGPRPDTPMRVHRQRQSTTHMTAEQRISNTFDNNDHDDIARYLDWLRNTIADCVTGLRKEVLLALLLMVIFELILKSPGVRINLGSFEIVKGSIVLQFIPALVAFLFFQIIVDSARLFTLRRVFGTAFSKWSNEGHVDDLDFFILPNMPVYWDIAGGSESRINRPLARNVELIAATFFMFLILFGLISFEAQAYYLLYRQPSSSQILWLISACVTGFCLIIGFTFASVGLHSDLNAE